MTKSASSIRRRPISTLANLFGAAMLLLVLSVTANAQSGNMATDGFTPEGLKAGAPAGSYQLSGFDNINYFNGNLNFNLPLLQVGGRGVVGFTIPLRIERKWLTIKTPSPPWVNTPEPNGWRGDDPSYAPGVLIGRRTGLVSQSCNSFESSQTDTLTRLTFTAGDGTEYELRDTALNGEPGLTVYSYCFVGLTPNRGRVFASAEGTGVTFISDTDILDSDGAPFSQFSPSGHLLMPDGARYRIDDGRVTWIRDRNGNKISFQYGWRGVGKITDSLNREVNIAYGDDPATPYNDHDEITWKGFGGAVRTIKVWHTQMSLVMGMDRSVNPPVPYTIKTYAQLFPEMNGSDSTPFNQEKIVSAVELPDGRTYQFRYNSYGELARVELPTGGAIEYDYAAGVVGGPVSGSIGGGGPYIDKQIYRRVVERRVYADKNSSVFEYKTTISRPDSIGNPPVGYVDVENRDYSGALLSKERHYYYGTARVGNFMLPTDYSDWKTGKEWKTEIFSSDGSTTLRRVENTWQQPLYGYSWPLTQPETSNLARSNNPKITQTLNALVDTNRVSKQAFTYDAHFNQTDVYEYDYGAGAPGLLIRRTRTTYLTTNEYAGNANYATDVDIHIRNLPVQKQVFDAGGIKRAETFYEYDYYNSDGLHAPLSDCPNISGHDGAFWAGYLMRGNVTRTSRALLDNNGGATGWVNNYAQYDIAGNVVKAIDSNGNATQIDFRDNFGSPSDPAVQSSENPVNQAPMELGGQVSYAFPFKITNALGHKAYTKYDYYLGRPALSEDPNGVKSNIYFDDALDRPTRGVRAIGISVASQTVFVYNDSGSSVNGYPARSITTISDKDVFGESNSGDGLKSVALYDGLGRTWRGAAYEGSTWAMKDTHFDALGRVSQVSNPYSAADPDSASPPSGLWTTTEYDALGRAIKVTTPDSAHVDTAYNGNQVTVTDQAGKKRRSETDALGRLVKVTEDPGGLGYETIYIYDALDNLRFVNQSGQGRWFAYDSLSRLIRVKNPEQNTNSSLPPHTDPVTGGAGWAMAYSYDANGNLVSKTDARNITTSYAYDALNRNTTVDYSDTAVNPDIWRLYDNPNPGANGNGRLGGDYAGGNYPTGQEVEHTAIDSYDALGRPLTKRQHFKKNGVWSGAYSVSYTYDLAGNVKTMTYPSGRKVNYSYDQAGRLSSFSGNLGGSPRTYADTIGYNAAGQMIKERFGTNTSLYHNLHYNNRQQLVSIRVGDNANYTMDWSRVAIDFFYGSTAIASGDKWASDTDNNGNLRRQITWIQLAGGGHVIPQLDDYTYDALNRLSSFTEAQKDSSGQWISAASQNYSYDPYGNRRITNATGGVNNYNPTYDPATNRIVGPTYDKAGNITSDLLTGGTMTYDAENRMLTASAGGGGIYTYDATGNRTRRTAGGQETWHVYGVGGELLAEYAAASTPSSPRKEYGYRGGQLLIVAESGSGGGVSFVKPASQSGADIDGQAGPGTDGAADGQFVDDEAVAGLESNEDSGSTTTEVSSDNNTGTLIDGVTGTAAVGYGNALSFNGVGGELLTGYPPVATPSSPQKEYGYRNGPSIVTVQSGGVVSVNPTANQSPDPGQGGEAVSSPSNTGHGGTTSSASRTTKGSASQTKTSLWHSFSGVTGTRTRVTLKFDWTLNASINVSADESAGATASYDFKIEYSLDNGSTWTVRTGFSGSVSVPDGTGGSDGDGINTSGSELVDLPNPGAIDISQIRIRDRIFTSASLRLSNNGSASSSATASVSNIRLEVETADSTEPVITSVSSSAVTLNSATISWNTNEAADSQVVYGLTQAYEQSTTLNPALVTAHSQGLSGLTPGKLYYYRVKSRDAAGNLATSAEFTFTTVPADTTAPVISNVAAGVTTTTATITWTTNENSDSQVVYGPTQAYEQSATLNPALVTAHSQGLSGLTPGTLYYYRVKSRDAAGNLATSAEFTFTTAQNGSGGIKWLVTDHLGSTRMVVDETGSLAGIKRHDFAPFGEELSAWIGIRSAALGYGDDSVRHKFDGYERDSETGLDFAQSRYFASVQGRFTSPDPLMASGRVGNPQSWNRYSYVLNRPLNLIDPSGMMDNDEDDDVDPQKKQPQQEQSRLVPPPVVATVTPATVAAAVAVVAVLIAATIDMNMPQPGIGKEGTNQGPDVDPRTPDDIYVFRPFKVRPQDPLTAKGDIAVDKDDNIASQNGIVFPQGKSFFGDPNQAPLTGPYYMIPKGTPLPIGTNLKPDGRDVIPNSPHSPTHQTLYPTIGMPFQTFNVLVVNFIEKNARPAGKK